MNGIIGVDLGGTKLLLIAERGRERTIETSATGAEFTPFALVEAIRDFRRRVAPAAQRIGIALPGRPAGFARGRPAS